MFTAHHQSASNVASKLKVKPLVGLSAAERSKRLAAIGPNTLPEKAQPSILKDIWEQLSNPIVVLLLGTAVVAGVTGEVFEAVLIFGIVLVMTFIGIFLQKQSEKSLDKLKSLQNPVSSILSDGQVKEVASHTLVPGDILVLHEGDLVAADARVLKAQDLKIDEASLTGESVPVTKGDRILPAETVLAEQQNMVFAGTAVVEGLGKAVVVRTAASTEVGKIATYLNESEAELTPLQQELEKVGSFLLKGTLVSVALILVVFLVRGTPIVEALLSTTSLAIAFIPEGLSAVLTITLALAVSEMVKKKVIVKKLLAAEGLGSITHIATDKTGTMTEGVMKVSQVYVGETVFEVSDPRLKLQTAYQELVNVIRFCNNNKGPTEQALATFLSDHGYSYELVGRKVEYRFTSEAKLMSVLRQHDGHLHLFSKGAPDILIPLCQDVLDKQTHVFTKSQQTKALKMAEQLAGQGFRVLALADRTQVKAGKDRQQAEQQLRFIGLIALMDPLRATVKETVAGLRGAGVTTMMITGDHPAIARYIAEQAGLISKTQKNAILVGQELDSILAKNITTANQKKLLQARVFARVKPEHKVQLVEFYQQQGLRIAMTGDGINDAAAIKKANIGIAMSNGAGLTKDIADVVITGTYDALLRAVSIGRTVKLRTQLYLHYLLSGNACEVGIFFIAVLLGWPIPLTPVMLLLINLLTDALPAIAMAVEPEDPQLLKKKSQKAEERILSSSIMKGIGVQGVMSTLLLSVVFWYFLPQGEVVAQTAVFSLYIMQKALRGFTARSLTKSVIEYGFFKNYLMNIALIIVAVTWAVVIYVKPELFNMIQLSSQVILGLFGLALIMPLVEEITKRFNARAEER